VKELLQTHSVSYAQGLQVALEAQGIPAIILDEQAPGYLGFAGRTRLMVAHDDDFENAMAIVRQLEDKPRQHEIPPSWKVQRWGLVAGAFGFVVLVTAVTLSDTATRLVVSVVCAAGVVLIGTGLTLIILGPRRDRQAR